MHRQLFETIMQQGIRRRESRRVARRCIGDPVAVADETYSAANAMLCPPPNPSESIVVPHFRSHLENAFWVLLRGPSWPHICRSTFGIPNQGRHINVPSTTLLTWEVERSPLCTWAACPLTLLAVAPHHQESWLRSANSHHHGHDPPFTPQISPIPLISGITAIFIPCWRISKIQVNLTVTVPGVDLPPLELEVEERHVGVVGGVVVQLVGGCGDGGRPLPTQKYKILHKFSCNMKGNTTLPQNDPKTLQKLHQNTERGYTIGKLLSGIACSPQTLAYNNKAIWHLIKIQFLQKHSKTNILRF